MSGRLGICGSVVVEVTVWVEPNRGGAAAEVLGTLTTLSTRKGMECHCKLKVEVTSVMSC